MKIRKKIKKAIRFVKAGALLWKIKHYFDKKSPAYVQIIPVLRCNLRCRSCHQREIRKEQRDELNYEKMKVIVANIKKYGVRKVSFIGGEIFLMKDIWEILNLFERNGILFDLGTNGVLLTDETINRLARYNNLLSVNVSIDGFSQTHDKLRGVNGAWEKSTRSVIKMKSLGIDVGVAFLLQKENMAEVPSFIRFLYSKEIQNILVMLEANATKEDVNATESMIENSKCIMAEGKAGYSFEELKEVVRELDKLKKELKNTNLGYRREIDNYYFKTLREKSKANCFFINKRVFQIDWNGKLNLCGFIQQENLPDLTKPLKFNPFNSKELNRLCESANNANLFPICERCCAAG